MADKNLSQVYASNPVSLDPGDLGYTVENTGTTPAHGAFKYAQLMTNRYKITPSVSSNDLVLALKHEDGNNPSTDRPLYFKIGNSLRACTAALSVTKADGTNWANLGSAELGTKEQDLFAYAVWNTALGTAAVDIFWSRISHGNLYSDFSATTTNEKYAAINATAPNSTDECVLIGRFAATLSLSGTSHLWTVPTYTNINLKSHPSYDTEWRSWTPTYTALGTGTPTYGTVTTALSKYKVEKNKMYFEIRATGTTGGTTVTTILATLPFQSKATADSGVSIAIGFGSVAGVVGGTGISAGTPDKISMFRYDLADMGIAAGKVVNISGFMEI